MTQPGSTDHVRTLAGSLASETVRVSREITGRIRSEIVELRAIDDAAFWVAVEEGTQANLDAGLAMMSGRGVPPRDAPLDSSFVARMAAGSGISLSSLLRAYRLGHRVAWDEATRAIQALEIPPAARAELLASASAMLFEYVDRLTDLVSAEYQHALDAAVGDREQRRLKRVRELVDGTAADVRDLGYELAAEHVAIVARGDGGRSALAALARELDVQLLAAEVQPGATWVWLGGRDLADQRWREALASALPPGVALGVGDPGSGYAGFRTSHRQAQDASLVGERLRLQVCHFGDVMLEALALRDEHFARGIVERELRGLDGGDDRAVKLRETLWAYFASGHSAAAAAALLGVHDQTISYRLRRVEECIGEPIGGRRAELELALRLERMLTSDQPDEASR